MGSLHHPHRRPRVPSVCPLRCFMVCPIPRHEHLFRGTGEFLRGHPVPLGRC
ncbi:Thioredoxin [Musa troglodytarum]|uniref:Thioredoxin n=1 Tax=Musa troglodytarum TaxID=320322 RepID=A0A9E7G412_9LILI|nr:Thioredoxin [Musa troglodytarum]